MATTPVTFFQSAPGTPAVVAAAGGGAAVNVAHGLGAVPTFYFAICRTMDQNVAALWGVTVTADQTNVIITPAPGAPAVDMSFDVFAFVTATVGSDVDTLANQTAIAATVAATTANATAITALQAIEAALTHAATTKDTFKENYPTAYTKARQGVQECVNGAFDGVNVAPISAGGTCTFSAAQLLSAFPLVNFSNPTKFWVNNPFCTVALTLGAGNIVSTITITNNDPVDAQWCQIFVEEIHSMMY